MKDFSHEDVIAALCGSKSKSEPEEASEVKEHNHTEQAPIKWSSAPSALVGTLYDFQYLNLIAVWRKYCQGQGCNVTVIDSGIDLTHPAFAHTKILRSSTLGDGADENGHGTWVAGKIVGQGVGIAPRCNLTSIQVLDANGSGSVEASTKALYRCEDADLVNMSLGSPFRSKAQEKAINELAAEGVIVVAAAGNYDTDTPFYPGSFDNCLTVAATDARRSKAEFSNFGGQVDIAAPGVACYSTYLGKQFRQLSGTSMATPIVTGLLALGVSYLKSTRKLNRKERAKLLLKCLEETARDVGPKGKDPVFGFGCLDALTFMNKLGNL